MKTLVTAIQKGGQGKTFATCHLAFDFLERGLREVSGTVAELARRIDMNRSHLQMLLKKHGLHSKDFRNRNAPPTGRNGTDEHDDEDADS